MARHRYRPVRAVAGVQVRLATFLTGEEYVTAKLWTRATITSCPWHPDGRCGFRRHGTYKRVTPDGCRVPRWYCPLSGRTVSALPDCLAAHRSGTLVALEAYLRTIEKAGSIAAAANTERSDIELPGALRFLGGLKRDIYAALSALRGIDLERFESCVISISAFAVLLGVSYVLPVLRADYVHHLRHLPAPLGFNPHRIRRDSDRRCEQHRAGRDPPRHFIEALVLPTQQESTRP